MYKEVFNMRNLATTHKIKAICFRPDGDIQESISHWLEQNPGLNMSRLANLAIRRFITEEQTLSSVKVTVAKNHRVQASVKRMMTKHSDMLDKLK